jgi:hypothetical protein
MDVVCGRARPSGRSSVQVNPTDCGYVIECDLETSAMRRPWPALGCFAMQEEEEEDQYVIVIGGRELKCDKQSR